MAQLTSVTCPNCGDDMRLEPKRPGGWVYCERCTQYFVARSYYDPNPPPWLEPVEIRCPVCVHRWVLRPEYGGRKVRCPHCDQKFRIISPEFLIPLDVVDPGPSPSPSRMPPGEVPVSPPKEETEEDKDDEPGSAPAPPAAETAATEARLREALRQAAILRDQVMDLRAQLEQAGEKLDRARVARRELKTAQAEIDRLRASAGLVTAHEAEIRRLQQEIQAGAATSNQLARDLERVRGERGRLREALETRTAEAARLAEALSRSDAEHGRLGAQIARLQDQMRDQLAGRDLLAERLAAEADAVRGERDGLRAELQRQAGEVERLNGALVAVGKERGELEARLDRLNAELEALRAQREESAKVEADRSGSAAAAAADRLREAEGQVAILRDQVTDLRAQLEQAGDKLDQARSVRRELKAAQAEIDRLRAAAGVSKAREAEIQRLQHEIQAGAATSDQLARDLERLHVERGRLREALETRTAEAARLAEALSRSDAEHGGLGAQLARLRDEMHDQLAGRDLLAGRLAADVDAIRGERDTLRAELERQAGEVERLTRALDAVGKERAELEARLDRPTAELEGLRAERDERAAAVASLGTELAVAQAELDTVRVDRDRVREEARVARAQAEASAAEVDRLARQAEADAAARGKPDLVPIGKPSEPTPDLVRMELAPRKSTGDGSSALSDDTAPPADVIPVPGKPNGAVAPVHVGPIPTLRVASRAAIQPVVSVRHVNFWFGQGEARKQVLYDNNLDLYPGELVIMTGPSGSGKTTLLTLIGALRSLQEGSIRVMDRELTGLRQGDLIAVRREIGFIFQAHNLFDALSAYQNVRMSLELKPYTADQIRKRATELLERLGLGHRIHYKPQALSGGQRQRVAIARALVNRPGLVLADEPTAALDKDSSHDVVHLLKELTEQDHCTVLMITHDNRILDIADRIVNMQDGSITSNLVVEETVDICEHLKSCPLLASLAPDTLTDLAEKMKREEYPGGALILRQGEPGDKLFLIREGSVAVIAKDRQRRVIDTIGPGDVFGEGSLLTGRPRNATIQAREDVVVYALEGADATAALESSPTLKEQLLQVFFQRSQPKE